MNRGDLLVPRASPTWRETGLVLGFEFRGMDLYYRVLWAHGGIEMNHSVDLRGSYVVASSAEKNT